MASDAIIRGTVVALEGPDNIVALPSKPRGVRLGELCAVRLKDVRAGKVGECVSSLRRLEERGFAVSVPKSYGFRVGESVLVRVEPVDAVRWFESDESKPLFSSRQGDGTWGPDA